MSKFLNVLLSLLMVLLLVGCTKVAADKGELVTVLESGGGYVVVEYSNGMVEKLWSKNLYSTFGIKPGSQVYVTSKENLELTSISYAQ